MITRIPPGALRRRAGVLAITALLGGGLLLAGGQTAVAVQAATSGSSMSTPPSVDITYKNSNPPRYPVEALVNGEQGTVMLDITVDASGNVVNVAVDQKRTNAATVLQSAAIAAASKWKFNPGLENGHPVGGVVEVPVRFGIATPCSAGFNAVGRVGGTYGCIPASPGAPNSPGQCLDGFQYKQGNGRSYSCIPARPPASAPPAVSSS